MTTVQSSYYMPISKREGDVQRAVRYLLSHLPYYISFYERLQDKQILAMFRDRAAKIAKEAIERDEALVAAKVEKYHAKESLRTPAKGRYELVCKNTCSLRFKYTAPSGKELHGIIAMYKTRGFSASKQTHLYSNDVCLVWESGKQMIMHQDVLISKIIDTSEYDVQHLVTCIKKLQRSAK